MAKQKYIEPSLFPEEEPHETPTAEEKEYDLTDLFNRLAKSTFRSRFHLTQKGSTDFSCGKLTKIPTTNGRVSEKSITFAT